MDLLYLGVAGILGVATYGLLRLCESLFHEQGESQQ
jgi:hypothetical protein